MPLKKLVRLGFLCEKKKSLWNFEGGYHCGRKPWQQTMNEWHTTKRSGFWPQKGALNSNRFPLSLWDFYTCRDDDHWILGVVILDSKTLPFHPLAVHEVRTTESFDDFLLVPFVFF